MAQGSTAIFGELCGSSAGNGLFGYLSSTKMRDITDGTSNTLAASECVLPPGSDIRGKYYTDSRMAVVFSADWPPNTSNSDDHYGGTCDSTTFAPCVAGGGSILGDGAVYARSMHVGGVHCLLADGAVRFISENIDRTTFQNLGQRNDNQVIGEF